MFVLNCMIVLLLSPGVEAPAPEATPPVHDGDECPQLFGTDRIKDRNRARRERTLLWAEEEASGRIEVTHSRTAWRRPRRTILRGVELLEADEDEAIVEVGPRYAELCPPGRYKVEVDDALGRGNQVLAVVGDIVLLESDDRLMWLGEPDDVYQPWRINWASWWKQPAPRMDNPVTVITGSRTKARRSTRSRSRRTRRNRNRRRRR